MPGIVSETVQGGGNRLTWADAPVAVRSRIETMCGSTVVSADTALGGFSPGLASTLTLANRSRVFAKAASVDTSAGARDLYRRERDVLTGLPPGIPCAHLFAAEEFDGWIVLLYAHIEGRHPLPSRESDLGAMVETFSLLSDLLDPSPMELPTFEASMAHRMDSWLRVDRASPARNVDPWVADNFDTVVAHAHGWREVSGGSALVHGDLRADNMLLTPDRHMVVLDWPESSIGAPWLDVVLALPSMAMFPGAPTINELGRNSILEDVDPAALTTVVAALAGFFLCASVQPMIPQLPTLRQFQRDQGI